MKLETKYDSGQEVWFVGSFSKLTPKCETCGGRKRVEVLAVQGGHVRHIHYTLGDVWYGISWFYDGEGEYRDMVAQAMVFPTEALAQAECERRNASG